MRVLHVIQRYWPGVGGSERHLQEVAERLARAGHEVAVYTTDALDFEYFWDRRKRRVDRSVEVLRGVAIRRFPVHHLPGGRIVFGGTREAMTALDRLPIDAAPLLERLARLTPWVPELERALGETTESYDLVHGMNICFESLLAPALALARRRGIPFVVTPLIHLGESERSPVRRQYTRSHQLRLLRAADAILAQTASEAGYLVEHGIPPERVVVAGVGVNPEDVLGGDAARFRAATGLNGPIVAYVGANAYDKGTVHLVEALRLLWEQEQAGSGRTAPTLVLAGAAHDSFAAYLRSLPERHRSRVHRLGLIDDQLKRDLLQAATVIAMPSRTDSLGLVYLEGWLARKPVIGARAGGVPDVIADGEDGFLVNFGDVPVIADRISTLLDNPTLARAFGERGCAKVQQRYTWDRVYPVIDEVFTRLARTAMPSAST